MHLGLVTYELAKDWDLDTIIESCQTTGFEGVELRTEHAHGVEVSLSEQERLEVKKKFVSSKIKLVGLGSIFEYHSPDESELLRNIEGTKEYIKLAADVGAEGVKVRPNALPKAVPKEKTLSQIGLALRECGEFGKKYGVRVRLEVHGEGTSEIPNIRRIMEICNHENVFVCWNSNETDLLGGSLKQNFDLIKEWIDEVHMRDLYIKTYPWRELFALLKGIGYKGFCLAEIPKSNDPIRVMMYYRSLWECLVS